jgi:ketosteroid isomerase-like protein
MKTESLRINQLSIEGYNWYLSYLNRLDDKDVEGYGAFLSDDCVMLSNNNHPVQDKATILNYLSQYWKTFGSLTHELLNIYGSDTNFVLEALNHYMRLDGKPVTVTAVAFTDRNDAGFVTSVRFYTDTNPVFSDV